VGPEWEGSGVSTGIGQEITRDGGGDTGMFVLLTFVCHGRLLELGKSSVYAGTRRVMACGR